MSAEKDRRRRALIKRDGHRCKVCGATCDLTIDHIVPRSRGGSNRLENLRLLCEPCNQDKGDRLDPGSMTRHRMRRSAKQHGPLKAPRLVVSMHLPECDGNFCMVGCPVFGTPNESRETSRT